MILYYSLCDTVKKSRPPQYCLMFQGLRHSCGAGLAIYTVEERNSLLASIGTSITIAKFLLKEGYG